MGIRYTIAGVIAAVVTFGIFFVMQALISAEREPPLDEARGRIIDFVRLKKESDLQLKKRQLPEKREQPEPPPPPDMDFSKSHKPSSNLAAVSPAFDPDLDLAGGPYLGAAPSDTDAIPLVRVNPSYPISANERGIEGWVWVEFTISAAGTVKNPRVRESEPGSVFDRAALRAIAKWKYRPKMEDGKAVERPGVAVKLTFELKD